VKQAKQAPLARQTAQRLSWASLAASEASQDNWQNIAHKHHVQAKQQPAKQKPQQPRKTDPHIFLWLLTPSSLRAIGLYGIHVTLSKRIPGGIKRVQAVSTGFAISVIEEGRVFLLSTQASELAGDGYFEAATEYHQVIIPQIPRQLWTVNGWTDTTIKDISIEAEWVTSIKPLITKLSKHPIKEGSITVVIAFPKKLHHASQLFSFSSLSRSTYSK
jgi:hypothetical protein